MNELAAALLLLLGFLYIVNRHTGEPAQGHSKQPAGDTDGLLTGQSGSERNPKADGGSSAGASLDSETEKTPTDHHEEKADRAAADRRVVGLMGAAGTAKARAETARADSELDNVVTRFNSARSTLETAIEVSKTHELDRTRDLKARLKTVEKSLAEIKQQRDGDTASDRRVIAMLGSAASSLSKAESAVDDENYTAAKPASSLHNQRTKMQLALIKHTTWGDPKILRNDKPPSRTSSTI